MSRSLLKSTHRSKINEDLKLNDAKSAIGSNAGISEILELSDNKFKAVIIIHEQ